MLYRKLFNDHNQTFLYRSPIVNEFGMRGSITDTHMGTWSGTQTPTIFYHLCGWNIYRYSMNICSVCETACIRRISANSTRTILQKNHLLLPFLNKIHSKRCFLGIWRKMTACCCRINTTNLPFSLGHSLKCSYILVSTVNKNHMMEVCRIGKHLYISLRNIPFIIKRGRTYMDISTRFSKNRGKRAVTTVTLGSYSIRQ